MLLSRSADRSGGSGAWRRRGLVFLGVVAAAGTAFALGPRPSVRDVWIEPSMGADAESWLAGREAQVPALRAGEAKAVWWIDSVRRVPTPLALVYLHGFSADRHEVEPLVSDLAQDLGANVFFSRLAGHGQDGEALGGATVEDWLADAAEAVAVGARIGERVVLVGTSTGATLALWAAARPEAQGRVAALVLVSPNLGLRDRSAALLGWPWGGQIARVVVGAERCFEPVSEEQRLHWTTCYPTRALLPMAALVAHVRSLDLERVRAPTLVVYSPHDQVVAPAATERVLASLGSDGPTYFVVDDSGDPAHHVVAGAIMSPGTTDRIRARIVEFLDGAGVRQNSSVVR
ncbi:MAG: alpha/beta fold hydrolase [Gemmatimonadetes bacterium]|nr:alpha/beta fold hydrolase [Gemmatimonadota bacterium]